MNRRLLLTGLCLASLLAVAGASTPAARPFAGALTPEQVVDLRMVNSVVMAPDGGTVVYTVSVPRGESEEPGRRHEEIHAVEVGTGTSRRLTHAPGRAAGPAFSPDGTMVAFLARRGDDEHTQVYLLPLAGGEARRLTGAGSGVLCVGRGRDTLRFQPLVREIVFEAREEETRGGRQACRGAVRWVEPEHLGYLGNFRWERSLVRTGRAVVR